MNLAPGALLKTQRSIVTLENEWRVPQHQFITENTQPTNDKSLFIDVYLLAQRCSYSNICKSRDNGVTSYRPGQQPLQQSVTLLICDASISPAHEISVCNWTELVTLCVLGICWLHAPEKCVTIVLFSMLTLYCSICGWHETQCRVPGYLIQKDPAIFPNLSHLKIQLLIESMEQINEYIFFLKLIRSSYHIWASSNYTVLH